MIFLIARFLSFCCRVSASTSYFFKLSLVVQIIPQFDLPKDIDQTCYGLSLFAVWQPMSSGTLSLSHVDLLSQIDKHRALTPVLDAD